MYQLQHDPHMLGSSATVPGGSLAFLNNVWVDFIHPHEHQDIFTAT